MIDQESGKDLRQRRESAGVLLSDLAGRLGIDVARLSKIERGRESVPADLPQRYSSALVEMTLERHKAALVGIGNGRAA